MARLAQQTLPPNTSYNSESESLFRLLAHRRVALRNRTGCRSGHLLRPIARFERRGLTPVAAALLDHVFPEELPGSIDISPVQNLLNELEDNAAVGLHDLFPSVELLNSELGRPTFKVTGAARLYRAASRERSERGRP